MSIGFLEYINSANREITSTKEEAVKGNTEATEYNLTLADLFKYDEGDLFITEASDYIKIENGFIKAVDDNVHINLNAYWLNVRLKRVGYRNVDFYTLINIFRKGTEYVNIVFKYANKRVEGSFTEILRELSTDNNDGVLAHFLLDGEWKIQY